MRRGPRNRSPGRQLVGGFLRTFWACGSCRSWSCAFGVAGGSLLGRFLRRSLLAVVAARPVFLWPRGLQDARARAVELLRQVRVHSERRASEREQHGHGVEERAPGSVEPRPLLATWRGRGVGVGVGGGGEGSRGARVGRARAMGGWMGGAGVGQAVAEERAAERCALLGRWWWSWPCPVVLARGRACRWAWARSAGRAARSRARAQARR